MKIIDIDYKEFVEDILEKGNKPNKKGAFKIIFLIILTLCIMNSFYSVDQTEYAVLTTFGVPTKVVGSGLKMKIPFGIQNVKKISKNTYSTTFGYNNKSSNNTKEYYANDDETKMITGDENIILADLEVQWRIVDPIDFLYNNADQEKLIKNIISASLRNTIGSSTVDDALTDGRGKIIDKIRMNLISLVDEYKLGITIVNVNLQDVDLPNAEVDKAFKKVTDAREERITKINEANKYKNEKINELEGKKSAILADAEAQKTVLIQEAKADIAKFNALYEEYTVYKNTTVKDMILNTLNEIYGKAKIVIVNNGSNSINHMSIDQFLSEENKN